MKNITIKDIKKTNLDDTFFGKYVYRFLATYLTYFLARIPLTPNHISILSLLFALVAATFFGLGTHANLIIGFILLQIAMILDYCDGQVARLKGLGSQRGAWFDVLLGMIQNNLIVLGIIIGLLHTHASSQSDLIWLLGFLTLFAWNMTCYVHLVAMIFFPKLELKSSKLAGKVRKGFHIKPQYLSVGSDVYFVLFGITALFGHLEVSLGILTVLGNLYWIAVFFYFFFNTKHVK